MATEPRTTAVMPGPSFAEVKQALRAQFAGIGLPVLDTSDGHLTVGLLQGQITFSAANGGVRVCVQAPRTDWMFQLKDIVLDQLALFVPGPAAAMRWSDGQVTGGLPSRFQFATVSSVERLGRCFLRVAVHAPNLESYDTGSIHFRLVLPPKGVVDIEWPYVAENGATIWPKGHKALHRPAYTTRSVDLAVGHMVFDVFIHEGGRVTEWACQAQPGDKIGLMGPGGAGVLGTEYLLLGADETAFPAAARILEHLPLGATGSVFLLSDDGADCGYPIVAPSGITLTWLKRSRGETLAKPVMQAFGTGWDGYIWVAGGRDDIGQVRSVVRGAGHDPRYSYIAAYWGTE